MNHNLEDQQRFLQQLTDWYNNNARKLPWRESNDPYHIWISEVMLQQTQVITVIPYYRRFIKRFPSISHLANADMDDLLSQWSGLGYYRRARYLKLAAEIMVKNFHCKLPQTEKELLALTGIGEYTAGAILSIAFNLPYPSLDGNVMRVLSRIFALAEPLTQTKSKKKLHQIAKNLIPAKRSGQFNQALMELGAVICLPKGNLNNCKPCPVKDSCIAYKKNIVSELPIIPEKRKQEKVIQIAFIIIKNHQFLVTKRLNEKVLQEMWEIPHESYSGKSQVTEQNIIDMTKKKYHLNIEHVKYISSISHSITYRSITCQLYRVNLSKDSLAPNTLPYPHQWITIDDISQLPHSSLLKKIATIIKPIL